MPLGEVLDDDLVASILRHEASSAAPSASRGFPTLLDNKPRRKDAPRPNTRFLRNLVRDTDTHNTALKAKEETEARARQKQREREGERKRKRDDVHTTEGRSVGERKRKDGDRPGRWANVFAGRHGASLDRPRDSRKGDRERERERGHKRRSRHSERDSERDQRSRSADGETRLRQQEFKRRSPQADARKPSRSPGHRTRRRHAISRADQGSDSDPLDGIISPSLPPEVPTRGRGAANHTSSIDQRFAPTYDPKADVSHDHRIADDDDDNDWSLALEALRDRAKWKSQGAERLKAAGFTDDEVARWEDGGRERDERDVKWRKRGEGREWDRGKVAEGEGVALKAEWARGKS
ncbi:hypothetical protein B0A50_05470 [Salinomyces thailandicus]|uniref:Pre-mRNA-splicing factor 38B n=1 Tax=Salinomyces thailandicus TaxID=706561 RepID=A0A4U0TUM2_9PEZI|nr:hypothetical protein B0A50_05470 [Salinomyces thailandica]